MNTDSGSKASKLHDLMASVHHASRALANTKGEERSRGIEAMAQGMRNSFDDILEANTLDLETSRDMAVPDLILDWLKLTPERLQMAIGILERIGKLSDPIRRVMNASYQTDQSQTYCQLMPLGVIALIYEAFPELGAIAAGFCLKTGNSLILKGSSEASQSNQVIAQALQNALDEVGLPTGCLELFPSGQGASIRDLVTQNPYLNLVIPHGRPTLLKQVIQQSTAPVLQSAIGNCYLYWSANGNVDLLRHMVLDSHASQPDPVNAIEKILINQNQKTSALVTLLNNLKENGFELRGDANLVAKFPEQLTLAAESEWGQAYLTKTIALKVVDSIESGIAWINQYSSGHADCLVTDSYQESRQFALGVDSASVYINSSPRFSRNPQPGDSVFLGMSNQKGHSRGMISLETLTTLKHVVQGNGQF
ncbi:MAG: glutamate-5-semialdehyde dehydrogenase [Moorea sp. SIO1F2]|uniref:glutamate-5-semialdehyde dehydrogenase n=1 Tax=unclassified Moorena TaxID=2683338 RepID=UPI0013B7D8FC|nr:MULTISPECIES: glutamate-5-semialdehyde dehydrogenase [unclassified Moorena]NEO00292.1 glutamate-5-semialdehyde dehydrogenase [Moorena sp. SIO3I7]NEO05141.1 glutamate-5-semialdehyde dehydrogenase [Moorena sp. SIO3I8]NEO11466.1 glutamate-5-semialdehyde dehydrogenase [Moorena sp. SIO3E8]NEO18919.1 glutamate-5-semialdehyde dehydrogenase [Moorena sp. SIO4A5]NEP21046.1 glutamate-5-semialdehyde dehydrogenase [Moorena sp. SIO3I6]